MATNTTQLRPERRTVRRMARGVATVAMAAGLMLGGGALAASPASAGPDAGSGGAVIAATDFQGPFQFWDYCQIDRKGAQALGYRVTPCFKDPDGWYYGIY